MDKKEAVKRLQTWFMMSATTQIALLKLSIAEIDELGRDISKLRKDEFNRGMAEALKVIPKGP